MVAIVVCSGFSTLGVDAFATTGLPTVFVATVAGVFALIGSTTVCFVTAGLVVFFAGLAGVITVAIVFALIGSGVDCFKVTIGVTSFAFSGSDLDDFLLSFIVT